MKRFVLVIGTGWTSPAKRRVARMIGTTLADAGLGLVTGNSDFAFREILKTWDSHPVPGLSRSKFLQLAEPWVSGTGPLANLLRGTLAETPDVFISADSVPKGCFAGRGQPAAGAEGRVQDAVVTLRWRLA